YRVEIAGRGNRKARLDDVHPEADEGVRHFQFFGDGHARARRLLAVAERRVEDVDALPGVPCRDGYERWLLSVSARAHWWVSFRRIGGAGFSLQESRQAEACSTNTCQ